MKQYSKIFDCEISESFDWIQKVREDGENEVLNEVFSNISNEWNDDYVIFEQPFLENDEVYQEEGFVLVINEDEGKFQVYKDYNILSEQELESDIENMVREILYNEINSEE